MAKHDVDVQLFYDAQFNDEPTYARNPVIITHGRGDEQATVTGDSCSLTFDNRDERLNPNNPASSLHGKIGRNTPLRIQLPEDAPDVDRFNGAVASWRPRRAVKGDSWTEVEGAGVLRRLGQGQSPLKSALLRTITGDSDGLLAYWPMEDRELADRFASALPDGSTMVIPPSLMLADDDTLPGSLPLPSFDGFDPATGDITRIPATNASLSMDVWSRMQQSNGTGSSILTMPDGSAWNLQHGGLGDVQLFYLPGDGSAAVIASAFVPVDDELIWHDLRVTLTQNGADVDVDLIIDGASADTGTRLSVTLADPVSVRLRRTTNSPVSIGHISVWDGVPSSFFDAGFGYDGELSTDRFTRLAAEEGVDSAIQGSSSQRMGPQLPGKLLDLLLEVEDVDMGLIYENRPTTDLIYETRSLLYNQTPVLTLDFAAGGQIAPPLEPIVDDLFVRNDVTVIREGGSSFRAVDIDGPLGVDAVGRYDTQVTVNTFADSDLPDLAGWRLALGTITATRYARVTVVFEADTDGLIKAAAADVDVGDIIVLTNLPDTPHDVALLVLGYTETIGSHRRTIVFNCRPAEPFNQIGVYGTAATISRYDSADSTLTAAVSAVATSLSVATAAGHALWSATAAPLDIKIAGIRLPVTAVTGSSSPQTFTVTRNADGFDRPLDAGEQVSLWAAARYGL